MAEFEPTGSVSVNYTVKELMTQVLSKLDGLDAKLDRRIEMLSSSKANATDLAIVGDRLEKHVADTQNAITDVRERIAKVRSRQDEFEGAAKQNSSILKWLPATLLGAASLIVSVIVAISALHH